MMAIGTAISTRFLPANLSKLAISAGKFASSKVGFNDDAHDACRACVGVCATWARAYANAYAVLQQDRTESVCADGAHRGYVNGYVPPQHARVRGCDLRRDVARHQRPSRLQPERAEL